MEPSHDLADDVLRRGAAMIRRAPDGFAPHEMLGMASAMKCLNLLSEMNLAVANALPHMTLMALRVIFETAVWGIYHLTNPDDWPRALVEDVRDWAAAAKVAGLDHATIAARAADFGNKGALNRDQMIDAIENVAGMAGRARRLREGENHLYKNLSRVSLHGGFGAVADHLGSNPDGIVLTPHPDPLIPPDAALRIAAAATGMLVEVAEDTIAFRPNSVSQP